VEEAEHPDVEEAYESVVASRSVCTDSQLEDALRKVMDALELASKSERFGYAEDA
jgi:hypothetical protein